jgi:DNA-binding NarL/FixJ family response regulator
MQILILESHLMMREFLRRACEDSFGHKVVGEAGNGSDGLTIARTQQIDLLLLDLDLPDIDPIDFVAELRQATERPPAVLVMSAHCERHTAYRIERLYVHGFIDKSSQTVSALQGALAAISSGQRYFPTAFHTKQTERRQDPWSYDKLLTDREQTILQLTVDLMTDDEIAEHLAISKRTVETHRHAIVTKLRLESRVELLRYARTQGFVSIPSRPAVAPNRAARACSA